MNRCIADPIRIVVAFSLVGLCYSTEALSQTTAPPEQPAKPPEASSPPSDTPSPATPPADSGGPETPPAQESPAGPDARQPDGTPVSPPATPQGTPAQDPTDPSTPVQSPPPGTLVPPTPVTPPATPPVPIPEGTGEEEVDVPIDLEGEEVIVIVGSRRQVRSKTDTVVPVDVVDVGLLESQGAIDMGDMLRTMVPGFNLNEQPISDAATLIRPANLRGLPPDMTVILVNGKRRHRGAVIAFLGGGVADGAQGVDTSVIPSIALQQVEVLRDGAAAQYGADAIAGVMNFVLRRNREGARFQVRYGSTYEGDGDTVQVAGNWGLPLTDKGFLNLSAEYSSSDPTSRSVQRSDAQDLRDAGNLAVEDPAQIWGAPEVSDNIKLFLNAGIDVGENSHTYVFGNYARRSVLGGFFFRNPNTRAGVFSNDGGETHLVGDLTPDDGIDCPVVPVGDDALLQQVMDDPNCFVFNELFPGGFTPQFGGDIEDRSLVAGVRGRSASGLRWDLSGGVGQSRADFIIKNTVNASLGPDTPTSFNTGAYQQTDQNLNLDLSYPVRRFGDLNLAGGLEYREEKFTIFEGDRESFQIGPLFDQGFSIGSNGFPGFSTDQAGSFKRRNVAGYIDAEGFVRPAWPVGVAVRAEQFDTFGSTLNGKLSTRIPLVRARGPVDTLAFRAMAGTGFRAPTPGQANVTNVSTVFDNASGDLINRGTIPPTNPIAQSKGGKELEPEKALNAAGGLVLTALGSNLSLTTDFYYIKIRDRISQSGTQTLTPEEAAALEASGVRGASDLGEFRFYTNAFDTTTLGIDVVGTYDLAWQRAGRSTFSLAYNWNQTQVDDFTPGVIDEQRILEIEGSLPKHRVVVGAAHTYQRVRLLSRLNFYSSFMDPDNSGDHLYGSKLLVDVEAAYRLSNVLTLIMGVQNLFNTFPDESLVSRDVGNKYPENAPTGTNGGFWYTRLEARL